jgi:GNAT superfamily N-acetyltransferase
MQTFRHATVDDAPAVGVLIDAMDIHYHGAGNTPGVAAATAMARHTIESREGARFLLAFDDTEPVGIACFAVMRPGHRLSGVLFLKDLFVPAQLRGRGIGRALMRKLAAWALAHDIGRIDLTTDTTNTVARALYEGLGGAPQAKVMFRYEVAGLAALAKAR